MNQKQHAQISHQRYIDESENQSLDEDVRGQEKPQRIARIQR